MLKLVEFQCHKAVSRTSRVRGYEPRPRDATPRSAFRIDTAAPNADKHWVGGEVRALTCTLTYMTQGGGTAGFSRGNEPAGRG